ncbi:MAG: Na/Pi cotransporter family protein [Bacilli bacterium]
MFSPDEFAFWSMVLGGLGLFLFGILSISSILKRLASKKLSQVINKLSDKPFKGFFVGTIFTAIIQSSSGTSALSIGLVRAGVMTFVQAAAIIIGANVGTTITSFIVSIPFMEYFPLVLFLGSLILLFVTNRKWKNIGELCFAFGSIFFGLWLMEINLKTLAEQAWFISLFSSLDNSPWLGLLIGTVATMCLQSSSAVIGVIQGIYSVSAPMVTLFGILPIVFGANIGTTVTAVFSCIGGSKESKKVALFHVLYNVFGALLFMGVIYIFRPYLENPYLFGHDVDGTFVFYLSPKLQLAVSHLIFNCFTALIFLLLLKPLTKLINLLIIDKDNKNQVIKIEPLDYSIMKDFPLEGLLLAKKQVLTMFDFSITMYETISSYLKTKKNEDKDFVLNIESSIDHIDRQLNEYLSKCDKLNLTSENVSLFLTILKACKDIERIGDYGENLINFYSESKERKEKISDEDLSVFMKMNDAAFDFIKRTKTVFEKEDKNLGLSIIKERRDLIASYDDIINSHYQHEFDSKSENKRKYIELVFVDIVNSYQRVLSHCANIAKIFGTDKKYTYSEEEEMRFYELKNRY